MGFFSKFEGKMEDTFEGAAGKMNNAPISPVQIMKKAEKQLRRELVDKALYALSTDVDGQTVF